jgi:hypothetical protein
MYIRAATDVPPAAVRGLDNGGSLDSIGRLLSSEARIIAELSVFKQPFATAAILAAHDAERPC